MHTPKRKKISTVSVVRLLFNLFLVALFGRALYLLVDWAIISAIWSGSGADCRNVAGACWAFIGSKYRLIVFGIYPPGEQWRPILVIFLIILTFMWSLTPRNWMRTTILIWTISVIICIGLLSGGIFGLRPVPTEAWGGLPLTLLLTVLSLLLGFPLAVCLALGRSSKSSTIRYISILLIEAVRGLPLLSLLFIVSVMLPLLLPAGVSVDKLVRAIVALVLYAAAYLAEIIRGGLQGVGEGQREAAFSLGMSKWKIYRSIILPQALIKVVPPLANTAVIAVKNTAFVLVIGLFDLLSAGQVATLDANWPATYAETYLFVGSIYFIICFSISCYARWLEGKFSRSSISAVQTMSI